MKIDILCCIAPGSEKYAELLRKSLLLLQSQKHELNFKCVLSGSQANVPDGYEAVGLVEDCGVVSVNHGRCLQSCFDNISSEISIFAVD